MERSKTENKGVRPGLLLAVGAIVVALLAAKLLGWLGGSNHTATAETSTPAETPAPESPTPPTIGPPRPRPVTPVGPVPGPGQPVAPAMAATPAGTDPAAEWSNKLDDVLSSAEVEALKAERLLALWPGLPPDGQVEVMQHITNLLPDDKFSLLYNTFTNAHTHEEVLDVLMTDALNRPNGIKLPALLDVARTAGHPKAEEARDILEVFVDENHGADWAKWEKSVQDWLKANPDEAPEEKPPGDQPVVDGK